MNQQAADKIINFLAIEVKHNLPIGHWGSVKNYINALVSEGELENPWEVLGKGIRNRPDRGTDTEITKRMIGEFIKQYDKKRDHTINACTFYQDLIWWLDKGKE